MPKLFLLLLVRLTSLCAFPICDDHRIFKINFYSFARHVQLNSLMHDVKRILKEFAKNVFFMYSSLHRQLHFLSLYVLQAVLVRVLLFLQQTALFLHPSSKALSAHSLITTSLQLRYIIALVVPLYSFNGKRLFILKLR